MIQITDMNGWLMTNGGRVYRYLVYRRMYTPYEQEKKYIDESQYEDTHFDYGYNIPFQAIQSTDQIPSDSTTDTTTSGTAFSDVAPTDYFYEGVQWAVERNVTTGVGDGRFAPNDNCTVSQILTFIWRAQGQPEAGISSPYSNLNTSDYYYTAVLWAYEKGIYTGTTFDPDQLCTRSMTVEFFWRMSGSPQADTNSGMTDVPADASYASAVTWALANNVTTGTGNSQFSPDMVCTRGQIVTFLSRIG